MQFLVQFSDWTISFLGVKVGWLSFFFVAFWFPFHQVRHWTIIAPNSGVSAANLRFNGSLVMPHFILHLYFALSIFNPNCGNDIWFISSKLAETKSYKWCKKKGLFRFKVIVVEMIFCSLNWASLIKLNLQQISVNQFFTKLIGAKAKARITKQSTRCYLHSAFAV